MNMLVGFVALATGRTGDIIVMSVLGALTLYFGSMLSLFRLRKTEPDLARPYSVPLYPVLPAVALVLSLVCFAAVVWYNQMIAGLYFGVLGVLFIAFLGLVKR